MTIIEDKNRKCALYIRVSTSNQAEEGESLDEQVEKLKSYCKFKGWKKPTVYREEGCSGKDTNRPEFQKMMSDVHNGTINTVMVKKVDRLSRSIIDFENIYSIFEEKNVDLISLQENFDTSTALGRGVIRIVLVFAQLEREQTSERTIDVMAYRAKQGLFNGGYPSLGYDIDYGNKKLVVNKSEVPIVKEVFKAYLELGSLSKTAEFLNNKGHRMKLWVSKEGKQRGGSKFQKNNIGRLLKDPTYIGKVKYKEKLYKGQHKGIIKVDLFTLVQSMLGANNTSRTGYRQDNNDFLLKGIIFCGSCKSAMTTSFAYSRGKKYHYYRCTVNNDNSKKSCRIGSVNARQVEELVVKELKFLAKEPAIIESVVKKATKEQKSEVKILIKRKKTIQDKLSKIDRQAKNLVAIVSDGQKKRKIGYLLKELESYDLQAKEIRKEIEEMEFKIGNLENHIVSADVIRESFNSFKDVYDLLTRSEQYDLLHLVIKRLVYFEEAKPETDGSRKGNIKLELWELPDLSHQLEARKKKGKRNRFAERPDWLPGTDSNRRQGG